MFLGVCHCVCVFVIVPVKLWHCNQTCVLLPQVACFLLKVAYMLKLFYGFSFVTVFS